MEGTNETVVLDGMSYYQPEAASVEEAPQQPFAPQQPVEMQQPAAPQYYAPLLQLPTNRGLAKMFFLSLITFGIYAIVIWNKIASEIDIVASRYDGKRTCPFSAMIFWLTPLTFGIYAIVWIHKFSNRVGAEVKRRGYDYSFSATDYWLWSVLGSFIVVGPFVYIHKLLKSMNLINESYNTYG